MFRLALGKRSDYHECDGGGADLPVFLGLALGLLLFFYFPQLFEPFLKRHCCSNGLVVLGGVVSGLSWLRVVEVGEG